MDIQWIYSGYTVDIPSLKHGYKRDYFGLLWHYGLVTRDEHSSTLWVGLGTSLQVCTKFVPTPGIDRLSTCQNHP